MILVDIINILFFAFYALLFASIIFSWIRLSPYHPTWGPVVRFVDATTQPILSPIRRLLPPMGGLDFSPMIALLLVRLIQRVLVDLLI